MCSVSLWGNSNQIYSPPLATINYFHCATSCIYLATVYFPYPLICSSIYFIYISFFFFIWKVNRQWSSIPWFIPWMPAAVGRVPCWSQVPCEWQETNHLSLHPLPIPLTPRASAGSWKICIHTHKRSSWKALKNVDFKNCFHKNKPFSSFSMNFLKYSYRQFRYINTWKLFSCLSEPLIYSIFYGENNMISFSDATKFWGDSCETPRRTRDDKIHKLLWNVSEVVESIPTIFMRSKNC